MTSRPRTVGKLPLPELEPPPPLGLPLPLPLPSPRSEALSAAEIASVMFE